MVVVGATEIGGATEVVGTVVVVTATEVVGTVVVVGAILSPSRSLVEATWLPEELLPHEAANKVTASSKEIFCIGKYLINA